VTLGLRYKATNMTIKELIDVYVAAKGEREDLNAKAKALTVKLTKLEADIMEQMSQNGLHKAASDKASVTMRLATHPAITDWNAFYAYVAETKQFELLHKRLSSTAFKERFAAGETIPGTTITESYELSVYRVNP